MQFIESIKKVVAAGVALKKLKHMEGPDGLIWSCDVYLSGKRLGSVLDDGNGGGLLFDIKNDDLAKLATALRAVDYPLNATGELGDLTPKTDHAYVEWVLPYIADNLESLKKTKRIAKTKTMFVLEGDVEGDYWVLKTLYTTDLAARLRETHGKALKCIVNEALVGL